MARPTKVGIPWFPLNVDVFDDEKFVAMNTDFGSVGELAILKLYCMIYDKGYYIKWEPLVRAAFVRKMSGDIDKGKADEIVDAAAEYGIFDRELFITEKVLTCRHVQGVFANATTRRTGDLPTEFWLLDYPAGSKKRSSAGGEDSGETLGGGEDPSPEAPDESPKIVKPMNQGDNDAEKLEITVIVDNNEVITSNNDARPVVIASKSTQSRVEYSIVDNSKEEKKKKNTKKRDQKPAAFDPSVYEFSFFKSEDFLNAWRLFCDHRKAIKKPLSLPACNIIHKQLSTETEAVAIELLNKTVSSGWTGVKPDWMKDEEKEKINKQAISKELGEIKGMNGANIPKELLEERRKRQSHFELIGSSSPHKLKNPVTFPLEISIYHKVTGFPSELRENVAEIIKRINNIPTRADRANYSGRIPLFRYPHSTNYFKSSFDNWRHAVGLSTDDAWEKVKTLCAYNEPVSIMMLQDAIKANSTRFEEITSERLQQLKQFFEPKDEEEREFKERCYSDNELAWIEYRRRDNLLQIWLKDNPGVEEDKIPTNWPEWVSTFHNEIGTVDSRKRSHLIQQDERSDVPPPQLKW